MLAIHIETMDMFRSAGSGFLPTASTVWDLRP